MGRDRRWRMLWIALVGCLLMVRSMYGWERYIEDVKSEKIITCKWVKLAVARHIADIERQGTHEFPFVFDDDLARRAIEFIEQLPHTKGVWASTYGGRSNKIKLEDWQQFIIAELFGWVHVDTNLRRFNRAYIQVARKNGKTTMGAGIANYVFFADRPMEHGPEIYFGATKQEQAAIAWREAKAQIKQCPPLAKRIKCYESKQVITKLDDESARMRPLGRDSNTEDGLNPSFALIDEYHAHPDASLLEVIESGMGAREQPLVVIITTAGLDKTGPCFTQEVFLAEQILEGSIDPKPENYFAVIYTLDESDDWEDEKIWVKANPNLGVSVKEDYIAKRVQIAKSIPSKQNDLLTKNFDIWTQAATRWITDEQWMACRKDFTEEELEGRHCILGMDLSSTTDITALILAFFPMDTDPWLLVPRFFYPEDNLLEAEKRDARPYTVWASDGLIIPTPGNIVDYDYIEQEILLLSSKFVIDEIVYDPWKAQEIVNHLSTEFEMVQCPQRYNPMAIYSDTFEKKVLSREIAHDGNPILRWMMACTEVKSDRQNNIMPMKPRRDTSGKRIDGIVAAVMAVGRGTVLASSIKREVVPEEVVG
jgi:phage terminase large subunit-like protein